LSTRSFTRVPVHIEACVRPEGGTELVGRVRDVSLNGLSVDTPVSLDAGTACSIRILLGTGSAPIPIHAVGTVAWSGSGVVALRLDRVAPEDAEHLSNLVLYNAPDPEVVETEADRNADDQPTLDPDAAR